MKFQNTGRTLAENHNRWQVKKAQHYHHCHPQCSVRLEKYLMYLILRHSVTNVFSQLLYIDLYVYLLLVTSKPTIKELQRYIIPRYGTVWRKIGRELGFPDETLAIIDKDHSAAGVEKCCHEILSKWLEVNTDASWQKLSTAIGNCTGEYFIIC